MDIMKQSQDRITGAVLQGHVDRGTQVPPELSQRSFRYDATSADDAVLGLLHDVHLEGARLIATVDSALIGEAMALLTPHGITSLTVEPPSLESLFLRLYEDQSSTAATP